MKKLFVVLVFLMLFTVSCEAATDVNFGWDYVQGGTPATGFEIRLSTIAGGAALLTTDCGMPATYVCKVPLVPAGNWFATVRAYATDVTGKIYSNPSNELAFTLLGKPGDPTNLKIK